MPTQYDHDGNIRCGKTVNVILQITTVIIRRADPLLHVVLRTNATKNRSRMLANIPNQVQQFTCQGDSVREVALLNVRVRTPSASVNLVQ